MNLTVAGLIGIILSSSVLAALLSAVASHVLSEREYKRDYHREVFRRRLDAYERVQHLTGTLRRVVHDDQGRISPMVFATGIDGVVELQGTAMLAMEDLWVDLPIRDLLVGLNRELLAVPPSGTRERIFEVGVDLCDRIRRLREHLEEETCKSLRELHNVDSFLKRKQAEAAKGVQLRVEMLPLHRKDTP